MAIAAGRQSAQEVGNVLKNGELWKVLQGAFDDAGPDAVKKAYLCDFVAMVYKVQTDHKELEYQVRLRGGGQLCCFLPGCVSIKSKEMGTF